MTDITLQLTATPTAEGFDAWQGGVEPPLPVSATRVAEGWRAR